MQSLFAPGSRRRSRLSSWALSLTNEHKAKPPDSGTAHSATSTNPTISLFSHPVCHHRQCPTCRHTETPPRRKNSCA